MSDDESPTEDTTPDPPGTDIVGEALLHQLGLPDPGVQISGRYRLDEVLARGGMGVVYRGHDMDLEREVAVKILPPAVRAERSRLRFIQECKLTANINHPNVVRIYDAGFHDTDMPYLVMEMMHGSTLRQRVKGRGPLKLKAALSVTIGVCHALNACHTVGVFHRDVKPGNVFLRTAPIKGVVLFDFGLSISYQRDTRLTAQGAVVGTPAYMAPEQVLGRDADERSDVYGAGAVMYQALVAQRPIAPGVEQVDKVFDAILDDDPIPPHELRPSIPVEVSQVALKALAKSSRKRFQSAQEMADACGALLARVR